MEQLIVYGLIWIASMLALLGAYLWATRADKAPSYIDDDMHPGTIFGDASLLDHPSAKRREPPRKREPEPRGA